MWCCLPFRICIDVRQKCTVSLFYVMISSTATTRSDKKVRCKFWPCCSRPDCNFVHPRAFCKSWAELGNCLKGSECFYIHPCCALDQACPNLQCPLLHSNPFAREQTVKGNMRKNGELKKCEEPLQNMAVTQKMKLLELLHGPPAGAPVSKAKHKFKVGRR
eukprot:Protomagalhaensia_wolfi_Nauph_80__163@NODE_1091_length_1742_cov_46_039930_g749_i1_p2_GENE_NODE_1091_length_1742_cov_46_039930_g749_i1NODE_1091_length_1742_cov_46_039930_g749_i1_p2_ORF_typecomplete_len161_score2_76zfCCCH_2/PF14608_6/0_66zfCCCH_2/PF14608_6/0_0075zfCCCH_2/PF14608_6/2e03zf_CCCH_4/PF18345_1/1_1e03zf_CCCH_4/PF18345_1/2_9e03zf_CCCH_4/PF18345_1/0_0042zfCCCH_4/PF18044_1/3_2e03zfCCCH_4/PF18044_1/6_4e02zfCCCH_4/PF18044_1/0_0042zfCCCH/PF00642_24/4_8e02zfCCCH/PF00642_24/1_6e02zfCCCH/PF00642_